MIELPKRKHLRLENFDYSSTGAYFITVCTNDRKHIFWENVVGADIIRPQKVSLSSVGKIVEKSILEISKHYQHISVDKYCIMPDHIHLLLSIRLDENGRMISAPTISTVIGSMKRWVSKKVGKSVWQKSFYDHGIRNRQDYNDVWEYIENNPLKYFLKQAP